MTWKRTVRQHNALTDGLRPSLNAQSILKGLGLVLLLAGLGIAGSILPLRAWLQQASGFAAELGAYGLLLVSLTYIVAKLLLVPGILITLAVTAVYG